MTDRVNIMLDIETLDTRPGAAFGFLRFQWLSL